jgi:hypothetical protein
MWRGLETGLTVWLVRHTPNGNGEQWIGYTYGATAPVIDPTTHARRQPVGTIFKPRVGRQAFRLRPGRSVDDDRVGARHDRAGGIGHRP